MKILITTGIFMPEPGGPATYTPEIATCLVERGHMVKVITYSDKPEFDFDKGFNFELERIVRSSKVSNYCRFFKAVLKSAGDYDLVYSLDWFTAGLPVMVATFLKRKKYLIRVGGGYIWERYLMLGLPPVTLSDFYEKEIYKKYPIFYFLIKLVFKRADHVFFNSDIQRKLFEKYYYLDASRLSTIYNPIPDARDIGAVRTDDTNEVVFAGRFIVMKNLDVLIRAFALVKTTEARLLIIGEGPLEKKIHRLITELHLETKIQIIPSMMRNDLYKRIINCRCFVIPSWTDISPNQAYEALALGIPFLLSKENYLAIHDQIPMMVDPYSKEDVAEKIDAMFDPTAYEDFKKKLAGIEFAQTWEKVTDQHEQLFNKVLHENPINRNR